MTRYGYPPAIEDCTEAPVPDGLVVKTSQNIIPPEAEGMHSWLAKPVSAEAIARQLNLVYADSRPVKVTVKGYGQFLLGDEGWVLLK